MIFKQKNVLIQKILFALCFILYLAATIVLVKILLEQFAIVKAVEGVEIILKYLKILGYAMLLNYGLSTAMLGLGFFFSIFNRLSSKKIVRIFDVFFVTELFTVASQLILGGSLKLLFPGIAFPVIMIIFITVSFKKTSKKSVVYIVTGAYSLYTIIMFLKQLQSSNIFSQANIIISLAKICVSILVFCLLLSDNGSTIKEISGKSKNCLT